MFWYPTDPAEDQGVQQQPIQRPVHHKSGLQDPLRLHPNKASETRDNRAKWGKHTPQSTYGLVPLIQRKREGLDRGELPLYNREHPRRI